MRSHDAFSVPTAEDLLEGASEVVVEDGVDNRVQRAVAVAEPDPIMSVPYTGEVILISQKCWPSPSSLVPRMAAVPQLYSM